MKMFFALRCFVIATGPVAFLSYAAASSSPAAITINKEQQQPQQQRVLFRGDKDSATTSTTTNYNIDNGKRILQRQEEQEELRILLSGDDIVDASLDLYIIEYYESFDKLLPDGTIRPAVYCNCTETEENSCIRTRTFLVEDQCYSQLVQGSRRVVAKNKNNLTNDDEEESDEVCMDFWWDNSECSGVPSNSNSSISNCSHAVPVDQCQNDQKVIRLPHWCIQASEPQGLFVVPMIQQTEYDDLETCQRDNFGDRGGGGARVIPVDKDHCVHETFLLGGGKGSTRAFCDGSTNKLTVERFSDPSCSFPSKGSNGTTFATFSPTSCTEKYLDFVTADCSTVNMYCKSLVDQVDFVTRVVEIDTSGAAGSMTITSGVTIAIIGIMVTVFVSLTE